ncbi:MAG: DUF4352 domain-containing protein [Patescibacteria group bacterium]|nr:DUF4352 domain-containing protein [Patescibacteria group bacterium]MDD4610473.1 DUF4352 domain-containing protein [Patescibacteria group bacterium]
MKKISIVTLSMGIFLCIIGFASVVYADSLAQRLAGRILLQTESKGEAWYINPVNKQRYLLSTPSQCFEILRKLGLGITNKNISQIPIAKDSPAAPSNTSKNTEATEKNQTQQSANNVIYKSVGDEIQNKTFKFKVNSVEEKNSISGSFGTKAAKADAKFVIINMSITNTTNAKYTFNPEKSFMNEEGFVLLDEKNRQFETYSDTIGYSENHLVMRDLSPSLTETGYLIYEIPNDAGKIGLVTQNANSGAYYVVNLN